MGSKAGTKPTEQIFFKFLQNLYFKLEKLH